jgi:c(7)-type cytochrome triheme protein
MALKLRWLVIGAALLVLGMSFACFPARAEYGDVVMNRQSEKSGVRPVIFSHTFHRIRFRCKVCHAELGFKMRAGANDVSMADIGEGKFCGMCHNDNIAWGAGNCDLCHSGRPGLKSGVIGGPQTGGPGRW